MPTAATLADSPPQHRPDEPPANAAGSSPPEWRGGGGWNALMAPNPEPSQHSSPPARPSPPSRHPSASAAASAAANRPSSPSDKFSTPPRARSLPSPWSLEGDLALDRELGIPSDWGDDGADADSFVTPSGSSLDTSLDEDNFLSALADNDFSSPSSYPSFLDPSPGTASSLHQSSARLQQASESNADFASANALRSPLRPAAAAPPSRFGARPALSGGGDWESTPSSDDFDDQVLPPESAQGSVADMSRSRLLGSIDGADRAPAPKRRRFSVTRDRHAPAESMTLPLPNEDDLFLDSDMADMATIDLTEATEVPEELKRPEPDRRVKISAFQCAICMDNVTTLTVTHCGHLFCQQCLHSSLHVDSTRGKCPMCRAKIDMKPRGSYSTKTKGFWPLELKLMTTTKKGKRKADALS